MTAHHNSKLIMDIVKRMYDTELYDISVLLETIYNKLYNSHLRRDPITNEVIDENEWRKSHPFLQTLFKLINTLDSERIARIISRQRHVFD